MEIAIFELLKDSLLYSSGFFTAIMDGVGGVGQAWLAFIMIHLLFRFVIKPVFGSAGSDRASKKNSKTSKNGGDE